MARGGRSRRRGQRDTPDIATSLDNMVLSPTVMTPAPIDPVSDYIDPILDDRRFFHPEEPFHPALLLSGFPAELEERHTPSVGYAPARTGKRGRATEVSYYPAFRHPSSVAVCIRRQRRREVLFALKRAGRGGGKRRKFNFHSKVRC